ncbi:PAS domain-containing protein [Methylocaldum sp.]|uniref:PAS domain-containing protein n=1 Tax=Methylocaldum sp. TaxID=1969727 RepID=UPI002D30BCBE|nr:PAS domain-containing protein [Methylocaldum sp.]HYE37700.1 PAS domain-containing protein [Methylocaldum sp.]
MQDMKPEDIVGTYREHTLTYFDGTRRKVLVTDIESPYPDGRLIVSRTDPAGIITHVNQSFVEMSGYSRDELIGTPHFILRHPDMPPAAFKDLWDTVRRGEKWQGYVKNLRKDGGFYWVKATVIPNIRNDRVIGYTSVRRKPSRQRIAECMRLYPTLF